MASENLENLPGAASVWPVITMVCPKPWWLVSGSNARAAETVEIEATQPGRGNAWLFCVSGVGFKKTIKVVCKTNCPAPLEENRIHG